MKQIPVWEGASVGDQRSSKSEHSAKLEDATASSGNDQNLRKIAQSSQDDPRLSKYAKDRWLDAQGDVEKRVAR